MRQTASEIMSALEDRDATFYPGMPVTSLHEPGFVLVFQTGFGTVAAVRQDDMLHAQVMSQLFVRFGVETTIATGLLRRLVEGFEVRLQAGFPLVCIAG